MPTDSEIVELERKRKALYACAMRYSTELLPLRHRVIDSAVLCALLDSNEKNPLKVGQIQSIINFGSNAPALRPEIIQESLSRLVKKEKIGEIEVRRKQAYFIREEAAKALNSNTQTIEALLTSVIQRHLQNYDGPQDQAFVICQTFLSECFAVLGSRIAQCVAKGIPFDDDVSPDAINNIFEGVVSSKSLSKEQKTSLRIRCIDILKSNHPEEGQLKFYFTNCFYVVQLLGLEPKQFDPLAEEAFSGSVFYLDTNLLILGLLSGDTRGKLFEEFVQITRRLGIELRVTRATIEEARGAAAERISYIKELLGMLPDEILKRSGDEFVEDFLTAREQNPNINPDNFFVAFEHISGIIPHWGVAIVEQTKDGIIRGRDFSREAEVIQQAAIAKRGYAKNASTLKHDLAHYVLILDQRKENPKTWFLTRDGILTRAGKMLARENPVFCFSLLGFLQSISPFVTVNSAQHTLATVFDKLLTARILPIKPLFEIRELHLLAEKNRDVLATPKDQLIKALEYAKSVVLKGQRYTQEEVPEVALALRTYLVSEADHREKELTRTRDLAVQQSLSDQEKARISEEHERQALLQVQDKSREIEKLKAENRLLEEAKKLSIRMLGRHANWLRAIGILIGLCLWGTRDYAWQFISNRWNLKGSALELITIIVIGLLGLAIICLSLLNFLRDKETAKKTKFLVTGPIFAAVVLFASFLKPEARTALSDALEIGAVLAGFVLFLFSKRERD
jgi:hypothetical protein